MPLLKRIQRLVALVTKLKPVRAFQGYSSARGPILASGLAYSALFSVFAAVWVLFSVAGLVLAGNTLLQNQLISGLSDSIPGLISTSGSSGAIKPADLLKTQTFSWTGIIALVGGLVTALGFLGSARDGIRAMFGLPSAAGNFVLVKLKDLAFLIGFAVTIIVSTVLAVVGTAATGFVLGLVGIASDSVVGNIAGRVVSLALVIAIDSAVVGTMLRLLAKIRIPWSYLRGGALLGGVGAAVLTVAFQLGVVGGASKNPLLGSFVVIIGLLVFFNFLCQVILIAAKWVATGMADDGKNVNDKQTERMPRGARPRPTGPRLRRAKL
ncbi:inner membrane protein YhjD [soil metagenome]